MFLWFFVVPELLPTGLGTWVKQLPNASFWTAVFALGFFTSARVAEQVKAGIRAQPRGQTMAATALGMTTAQTYRYVLLPMAFVVWWRYRPDKIFAFKPLEIVLTCTFFFLAMYLGYYCYIHPFLFIF
jgi:ABC-type arginine/histidine transport system permease subunit